MSCVAAAKNSWSTLHTIRVSLGSFTLYHSLDSIVWIAGSGRPASITDRASRNGPSNITAGLTCTATLVSRQPTAVCVCDVPVICRNVAIDMRLVNDATSTVSISPSPSTTVHTRVVMFVNSCFLGEIHP